RDRQPEPYRHRSCRRNRTLGRFRHTHPHREDRPARPEGPAGRYVRARRLRRRQARRVAGSPIRRSRARPDPVRARSGKRYGAAALRHARRGARQPARDSLRPDGRGKNYRGAAAPSRRWWQRGDSGGRQVNDTTRLRAAGRLAAAFVSSKLTPLFVLASILLGVFAVVKLPREEEPQIIVPMIDIFVEMPGASAREVEERVTKPMEKLLWEIPGVEYIYSTSSPGVSMAVVRFF